MLVTLTNAGPGSLTVSGLQFGGADPADFYIGASTCGGVVASGSSCQVTVRFSPLSTGARSATLQISSNDPAGPSSVALAGVGSAAPQGPTGVAGSQGPPGKTELVTCKAVTRTVTKVIKHKRRKVHVRQRQCTAKLISGTVKFKTAAAARLDSYLGAR
jgi:hypothetical protein